MKDTDSKVAVITGGAGGVGRAMGERFAQAGMKLALGDVDEVLLDKTVGELSAEGVQVIGVPTDVSLFESVENLRDQALAQYGAINVVCNNAGIGAGAEGKMWEHTLNDWKWGIGVNLWGIIHGIKALVPAMLEGGEPGHVVNTTSGNGGLAPLPSTAIYATTKGPIVTLSELLFAQLAMVDAPIGVSVLFPGPKMLRTGLFESWRHRPDELANARPRKTPNTTIESFEARMKAAGVEPDYTPVEEVAERVFRAIEDNQFWILPESRFSDRTIEKRSTSMLERTNPDYLQDLS